MQLHFVFSKIAPEIVASVLRVGQVIDGSFHPYDIFDAREKDTLPKGFPSEIFSYIFTDPQVFALGHYVENKDLEGAVSCLLAGSATEVGFISANIDFFNNNLIVVCEYE